MTLAEIIPTLRSSLPPSLAGGVWPAGTRWTEPGDLVVGEVGLTALAAAHGTPTYVIDEADVRLRCREYVAAFGAGRVAYTAKALLSVGVARWITEEGLGLYAGSAGELHVARAAGVPGDRVVLYGSAKTPEDLDTAYATGTGTIVVESLSEIARLAATAPRGQRVLLRVLAGPEPAGGGDHRFGLRIGTGEAESAVARITGQPGLQLAGFDCSVGHQINRFSVYEREVRHIVEFCAAMHARHGVDVTQVNLGGGHAVAYCGADLGFALGAFAGRIRSVLHLELDRHRLAEPALTVSPGRAIVSRSGLTLYRIIAVITAQNGRRIVAVDGGMTDCPTAALCGGTHTATLIGRGSRAELEPATVVGRHNDIDDVVVPATQLPADVHPGDLLAVAGTGAYHHCRASNYHLVARPSLLSVAGGQTHTLIRRESITDLLSRDTDHDGR